MTKQDFYKQALKSGLYMNLPWLISCFAVTSEEPESWKGNPYPYRVVRMPTGMFFVHPTTGVLEQIEGGDPTKPLIDLYEELPVSPEECIIVKQPIVTDYACLLLNYLTLVYPFGNKLEFINVYFDIPYIEDLIAGRLKTTPDKESDRLETEFYVDEFLKLGEACDFMRGLTQVCCWAGTEKSLSTHPDVPKRKAELFKQFEGRLDDPIVIAFISAELIKLDKEHTKGDPCEDFYLSKKSREVNRAKLFLMGGAESGLSDDVTRVALIKNSLIEGVDIKDVPVKINSLRAASFNRGAQTVLGGVSVKELLRALANLRVKQGDCKTVVGLEFFADANNAFRLVNRYLIDGSETVFVENQQQAESYIGKKLMVRSPQYCSFGVTDFCSVCVGSLLAANPMALPIAGSDMGSTFLSIYLAMAHGKSTVTESFNLKDILH